MNHQSIRFYRLQKGITQKDLAEMLHIAPNTLSDYETGKALPDMAMFQKIFNALGFELSLSKKKENPYKPEQSPYYTRKDKREQKVKSDMEILYSPLLGFSYDVSSSIENGELDSVWEFVSFADKTANETFLQNGVLSNEGKIYIRLYNTRGYFAVKKAVFNDFHLVEVLDEWATLDDVNQDMYNYIKYRDKLEARINDDECWHLNEQGLQLFSPEFYEKTFFGLGGEI